MKILILIVLFFSIVVVGSFQEKLENSLRKVFERIPRSDEIQEAFHASEQIVEKNSFFHVPLEYLPVTEELRARIQSICIGRKCSSRLDNFNPQHLWDTAHLRGTVNDQEYVVHLVNHGG